MWFILRLLKDQEEHFYSEDKDAHILLGKGVRSTVGTPGFVSYCSTRPLIIALLPFWILKRFRLKTSKEYTKTQGNIRRMRSVMSLVDSAKLYQYVNPPKKGPS